MICPICGTPKEESKDKCQTDWCRFDFTSNKQFPDAKAPEETIFNPKLTPSFKIGDTIADKYLIRKILGRGGMGSVYQVSPMGIDINYALKVLHPFLAESLELVERFKQEVIKGVSLDHPSIIRVNEYHEWQGCHFFTMQYLPGQSLDRLLKSKGDKIPPLAFETSVRIMDQVLSALSHAHENGIIHRDIKPANIMVTGQGDGVQAKVLDFGIARAFSRSRFEKSAQAEGAFFYIAPEQSKGIVDARSDLFSAGAVFYEMLTGDVPAGFPMLPSDLVPGLPPAIDEFIKKALAPFNQRFQTAREMREGLSRAIEQKPGSKSGQPASVSSEKHGRGPGEETGPEPGDEWTEPVTGMEFIYVPSGCFDMGSESGSSDEKPVHKVCLDGFWIGKYPVTQGQWEKIMGGNPSSFKAWDDNPVESVSWNDAQDFILKLNEKSKYTFALPSEAQWEYAARSGGKDETYSGGEDIDRVAWYSGNSSGKPRRVGTRAGNGLGIHDMSGNVWEWCEDVYDAEAYSKSEHGHKNPLVTSGGSIRVLRGGGWVDPPANVRCAYRYRFSPSVSGSSLGFRLIRRN